jgi:NADH-quinone oxidoreductase subunit G
VHRKDSHFLSLSESLLSILLLWKVQRKPMPNLIIDDLQIEVPAGTKVIEAAEQLGIVIPRFCFHKALGSVGACRVCAVKFLQGPVKGVQMSCTTDAMDGMVVSTTDEEAVAFRKCILELLMLNHPHDCPVCDEGGQCLLQDMTVSGGHGIRRYLGKKRTYRDQNLGVFIAHEMNRCIHCYRCSRFYQEFAGYRDLGPTQIANRVYFGRFEDGQLESPFSGNLVDVCPTGVYTDRPARFHGRRWDFERAPSLCIHCSLGCNTITNARYRAVVRVEARLNEAVNGYFICDRGRFGFPYVNHPKRPREPRVNGSASLLEEAVQAAGKRLAGIQDRAGRNAIACLGSGRNSLETQSMLNHFCRLMQWREPDYFLDPLLKKKVRSAISQLDSRVAVSLRQIEAADFILAAGVDPIGEAPMLALAMRQAYRREATVAVLDPRSVSLPFPFEHLAVPTWDLNRCLKLFLKDVGDESLLQKPLEIQQQIMKLATALRASRNPVLICGTDIVPETTPTVVGDCARSLFQEKGKCGLFYALPDTNAFGAGLLSSADDNAFLETVEGIERGEVKALIVVESNPIRLFPDRSRLEQALAKLEFLLVMDYVPSQIAQQAHIFLPSSTIFETGSTFINQEGRIQFAHPAYHSGSPISQVGGGSHPPRAYSGDVPGGEPKPAWQLLVNLAGKLSVELEIKPGDNPLSLAAQEHPLLAGVHNMGYPIDGIRCIPGFADAEPVTEDIDRSMKPAAENRLQLLLVDSIFGAEELSQYSDVIHHVEGEPFLHMHADDAASLGFMEGDLISMTLETGTLETIVSLSKNMAPGTLVLPRHRKLEWQKVNGFSVMLSSDRMKKV